MLENCQVFTPENIVAEMLDIAEYKMDLYGKKVLENSCGDGRILSQIVYRYISDCKIKKYSIDKIRRGLMNDIVGFEIDEKQAEECRKNLDAIASQFNVLNVQWNILVEDALKSDLRIKFNFVIGNPPYITYSDLDILTREYIKENFHTCSNGKADYFYAFIEKSIWYLANNGVLVYLIPNCIFKNVFAAKVRELIQNPLCDIYDYTSMSVFENRLTSSAIIKARNGFNTNDICYHDMVNNTTSSIKKESLGDKWVFTKYSNSDFPLRFGDFFHAQCSIATLCNDVFLLDVESEDTMFYYLKNGEKIEKNIVRIAVSPRLKSYKKSKHIIFPYTYEDDVLTRFTEGQFIKNAPFAYSYLLDKKIKLENTDKDESALWFEYGRSQSLQSLNQEKILISTVITGKVNAFRLDAETIPFSGIIITALPQGDLTLSKALEILQSSNFIEYIESIGVNARNNSKRISPKDINNYRFEI